MRPGRLSVELSHIQDTTSSLVDFGRSISLSDWHQAWSLGFFLSRFRAGFRVRFKIGRWRSRSLFKVGIRNRIHNNKVSGRISVLDLYFGRWLLGRWLYNFGRRLKLWALAFNTWTMAGKPLERRLPRGKFSDPQRLLTADPPSSLFPSFSPFFPSYLYPFGSFSSSSSSPDFIPVQTTTGNTFARGTACCSVK